MFRERLCYIVVLTLILCLQGWAQISYADVAVIVNSRSTVSDSVGNYFATARNIPRQNIIRIAASSNEEVDSLEFNSIRQQIESYLIGNNLESVINYIVTTKGMPLRINRGNLNTVLTQTASLESELTLILGPYSSGIAGNCFVVSPYFEAQTHFSRSTFGIYLVTRLDGYTFFDIKGLIDRAAGVSNVTRGMHFVFDQDPTWNKAAIFLNWDLAATHLLLRNKRAQSVLDTTMYFMTRDSGVIGYASFGSNDYHAATYSTHAIPLNAWARGAIVETFVSTSRRTFNAPAVYGQSLIADLVHEGVTGAKGYVSEPFTFGMVTISTLFDRYTNGYNLAESYFMATRPLSWMGVVIGDPKAQIQLLVTRLDSLQTSVGVDYGSALITWGTRCEYFNRGFYVDRKIVSADSMIGAWQHITFIPGSGNSLSPAKYIYVDRIAKPWTYLYRIVQVDSSGEEYVSNTGIMNIPITKVDKFALARGRDFDDVRITWESSMETQNRRYVIERKDTMTTGKPSSWILLASIGGKGTCFTRSVYAYTDHRLRSRTYLYRLTQIDSSGTLHPVNVLKINIAGSADRHREIESDLTVSSADTFDRGTGCFPNPFNPTTVIQYTIPIGQQVSVKVYNLIGQEMTTLVDAWQEQGPQQVLLTAAAWPSGTYFYRIQSKSLSYVGRISLMK